MNYYRSKSGFKIVLLKHDDKIYSTLECKLQQSSNVVIRTANTAALVIARGYFEYLQHLNLSALYNKNTQRFIDVKKLHLNFGGTLPKALPAYYPFTGCDYIAAFSRKGISLTTDIFLKI